MSKEMFYALELFVFAMMLILSILISGCATPRYADGTRAAIAYGPPTPPRPCGKNDCGKPAW